jgi:hypothetical protein
MFTGPCWLDFLNSIGTRGCHGNSIFRFANSPSFHANRYQAHGPCGLYAGGIQLHVAANQRAKCAESIEWHDAASHASATRGAMDGGKHSVVSGLDGGRLSALVCRVPIAPDGRRAQPFDPAQGRLRRNRDGWGSLGRGGACVGQPPRGSRSSSAP